MKILTACGGVGQSRHGGVEVVELILGQGQSGLLDVHQLLLVGQILLGGDQVAPEHVLLQSPPLQSRILDLNFLLDMVDIVDPSVDVQHLFPAHRQLISNTVSKALRLGQAEKESFIFNFLLRNLMSLEGDQYQPKSL